VNTDGEQALGLLLRGFRVDAGMSQEALAERAGLSPDAIAALEQGRRTRPRAFTLRVIADVLGLSAEDRARLVRAAGSRADARATSNRPWPLPLTTFVGRNRELAEIEQKLRETRFLTLCGPGGVGKTRLALTVAERWHGAAWFAALDACPGPALVVKAVADAVGAAESPGIPLASTLLEYMGSLKGLLVLDNCEHVVSAVAELVPDLLRASTGLRLLATSREVIQVPGEMIWTVPPLPEVDAVRLFAERAALARPDFAIRPGNLDAVAEVCRVLDGIPLAIELAAARSRMLTPDQIVERLVDALALLTGSLRSEVPRHQTMRAAVDWSCQLLSDDERRLFDWLSVFSGGFDLEAVEALWGGPVLDLLTALVDRSLVEAEPGDDNAMRYRVLEVLRQYGRTKLEERGDEHEAHLRHLEYHLGLAQRAGHSRHAERDRAAWLPRLQVERANLEAALAWSVGRADAIGNQLTIALIPFWIAAGSINEGRTRVEAALASTSDVQRSRALDGAAFFAFLGGDYDCAVARMQESVDLKRTQGDELAMARRLALLGAFRTRRGETDAGRTLSEQSLEIQRAHGDDHAAIPLANLGYIALVGGDLATAERRYREALTASIASSRDDLWAATQTGRFCVALEGGDIVAARAIVAELLPVVTERLSGMREDPGWIWAGMLLAEAEGRDQAALRMVGAIEARSRRGLQWGAPELRRRYQQVADQLRARADSAAASSLIEEGAAMRPNELAAEALGTER
jgi:predicted ATPase/DNA-binding XRE family transcriptional regulator